MLYAISESFVVTFFRVEGTLGHARNVFKLYNNNMMNQLCFYYVLGTDSIGSLVRLCPSNAIRSHSTLTKPVDIHCSMPRPYTSELMADAPVPLAAIQTHALTTPLLEEGYHHTHARTTLFVSKKGIIIPSVHL